MAIQIQPLDLATVYGNVNAIQNQQQQNKLLGLQTQQIQQQMANTQRINPLLSQLDLSGGLQGNQETLQAITGIDPQMGLQLQQSFLQMDAQQQAQARETLQTGQRFLAGILALPAEQQQQAYLAGLPAMEQMGVTGLPEMFDPAAAQAAYANLAELDTLFAPPDTRTIQDGRTNVTQQWNPTTRQYETIATGAMDAPKAAPERKTATDQNGVLRYIDTGEAVFPNVQGVAADRERATDQNGVLRYIDDGSPVFPDVQGTDTKEPTEGNLAAAGFADRMIQAESDLASVGDGTTADGWENFLATWVPSGNYLNSSEYQLARQAQENFVTAVLREESGAVIGADEMETEIRKYFPVPGDGAGVIAQKRAARETAINNMLRSAGPLNTQKPPAPDGMADEEWTALWNEMTLDERAAWQ